MFLFKRFLQKQKSINILVFYFLYIISINCSIQDSSYKYIKLIDLPSGKFFVILFNGIYIYEYDFANYNQIYKFKGNQVIYCDEDMNKTTLSEMEFNNTYYIACLVKNYLYLYDDHNNSIVNEVDLNYNLTGIFYNLNLFTNKNVLSCIITYIENTIYKSFNIKRFTFYKIDFFKGNKNYVITRYNYFDDAYSEKNRKSYISDVFFSCNIYEEYLICFYLVEDSTKIPIIGFNITNNFQVIEYYNQIYASNTITKIFSLKTAISNQEKKIFVILYGNFCNIFGEKKETFYNNYNFIFYYDISNYKFKPINIKYPYYYDCDNFQVYYFQ